jgi:hypothetical protein
LDWLPAGVAGGGGSPGFVVVFIGMNGSSRFSKKKERDNMHCATTQWS